MADEKLGAYNIEDLRQKARAHLPRAIFEFIDRGTEDDVALANNRAAFERIRFQARWWMSQNAARRSRSSATSSLYP